MKNRGRFIAINPMLLYKVTLLITLMMALDTVALTASPIASQAKKAAVKVVQRRDFMTEMESFSSGQKRLKSAETLIKRDLCEVVTN